MKRVLQLLIIFCTPILFAQLKHYDWPTDTGQAVLSDKYEVYVKHGSDPEIQLEVLMSNADPNDIQYDGQTTALTGRTFSYAAVSYNDITGSGLTFRVVKTFGGTSTKAKIAPKSYNISPTVTSNQVVFNVNANNKYISINFDDDANETNPHNWIKHMLMISVDPPEFDAPNPNDAGVVVYSNTLLPSTLRNATTIYFPSGYHNLRDYQFETDVIDADGIIYLASNKKMYLEGGAFVEGLVSRTAFNTSNQKLFGRGVLNGRQYEWQDGNGNKPYGEIVRLGEGAQIIGVHLLDTPKHGIVGRDDMLVENIKFLGWHANNDGIRIGSGSEIRNSFMRCVDDFFYNYNNYVHDCVFWAGHNGAILTYGWASIDTGSSFFENIDIINPEWRGLGNNNSLIAAQVNLDFNVIDYGTGVTTTTFKDIRIEGSIPGLTNLKPRSSSNGIPSAEQVPASTLGYLGDVHFQNITVESQFERGRIRGQANATSGGATYYTKNINFTNVNIGGTKLTEANKNIFFDIDENTTQNITFDADDGSGEQTTYTETFNNISLNNVLNDANNPGLTATDFDKISPGDGEWFTVQGFGVTDFGIQSTGGNPQYYVSRVSSSKFARAFAYVYNNSDDSVTGIYDLGFDYFFNSSFSNTSNERFGYRIYGLTENTVLGSFPLTSGSGFFGDNNATGYNNGGDEMQLIGHTELPISDDWTNSGSIAVDFGTAGTYKYIIVIFGQVFGTDQQNPETLFGVDNVVLPTQSNPQVLSLENNNLQSKFSVYPNPVSNILNLTNIEGDFSFKVFDITGKILLNGTRKASNKIDVSSLKKGLYFLEISSETIKSIKKIVKN
ncbi:T9SS type A sorting domain-containing protein [Polaribacter sp. M15]